MKMEEEISDNSIGRASTPDTAPSSDSDGPPVRNRGRGAGRRGIRRRGGGRGRGVRGRGGQAHGQPHRGQIATETRVERERQLQERIANMTEESMRETLMTACREHPSFIFRILDRSAPNGEEPQPSDNRPNWCRCTRCREMPTEIEKKCCGELPQNCHSTLPDFHNIVLDELVLEVAMRYRNDMLAQAPDENYNRCHRHAAYRQYILWTHGHLGAGNRMVIPSCCVWKIRGKYPDESGQYVGFIGGRFA